VLTARKQFIDEPLDLHLSALDRVRVIEVPYGLGENAVVKRLLRAPFVVNRLRRLKALLQKSSSKEIDPRGGWFNAAIPFISELAGKHDFVVSTFGPRGSHQIANAMKRENPGIFWVADYRDLWDQHGTSALSEAAINSVWEDHKASVGIDADLVTAVSEDMVQRLTEHLGKNVILAPNGFDIHEADLARALRAPSHRSRKPIKIVHTGTVYRGHRDPTPLLEMLAAMLDNKQVQIGDVFLDFYGRAVDPIRDLQKNPRFHPFIRVFGHVSREAAMEAQRDANMLLLLESSEVASRGILTGKIFEYITAGRPILCVGSNPQFEIGLLLQKTGTGRVVGRSDGDEIRATILGQMEGGQPPSWFCPKIDEILLYSRKKQALRLLDELAKNHA
jgi:hypothetical protein